MHITLQQYSKKIRYRTQEALVVTYSTMSTVTFWCIQLHAAIQSFLVKLFSQKCLRCTRGFNSKRRLLCQRCEDWAERKRRLLACPTCAATMVTAEHACGVCLQNKERLSAVAITAAFAYEAEIKARIWALKFQQHSYQAKVLIALMMGEKQQEKKPFDMIVPVPMHWRKVVRRGYNQTDLLAKELAKHLRIPWSNRILVKKADTTPQQSLGRKCRWQTHNKRFEANAKVQGLRVLLVDDIITTGATLHACAKTCYQQGAATVTAWVVAYTEQGRRF